MMKITVQINEFTALFLEDKHRLKDIISISFASKSNQFTSFADNSKSKI